MGQVSTEQTVQIIDSVANALNKSHPEEVMRSEPNMNFWPLLLLAIIPVVLGYWLNKRKKRK